MVNEGAEKTRIKENSEALDSLFDSKLTDVAIRFELDGYVLCLEIRKGKVEIIFYKL